MPRIRSKPQTMTCGKLIEILKQYDPNRPVIAYPQTDYNKQQVRYYIKGSAELDYDNQVALLLDPNMLVGVNFDKVRLVDEDNGFVLSAETDNAVHVIV